MYNTVTMPNHVVWRGEVHTIKEKEEKGGRGRGGGGGGGGDSRKGGGGGGGGGLHDIVQYICVHMLY